MKITPLLATGLLALMAMGALAQPGAPPRAFREPTPTLAPVGVPQEGELSKFDLDFPGGTPRELVAAIQKGLGKPLNVIIPEEYADTKLPALKMRQVNIAQLFEALQAATTKSLMAATSSYYGGSAYGGYKSYQQYKTSCGFRTAATKVTDETVWYFYVDRPVLPEGSSVASAKVCRFYALAPYLERHLTVDDITTAIETGWRMLGEGTPASISFHKDTKLLIAVGEPTALETIDAVLKALEVPKPGAPAPPPPKVAPTSAPKPGETAPPAGEQ